MLDRPKEEVGVRLFDPEPFQLVGDLTMLEGGAMQLDLKGYEGDQVDSYAVRPDFEKDGTLRLRVWSLKGPERSLMLNVHTKKLQPP